MDAGETAACVTAMERMERVVIEDVIQSSIFIGSDALEVLLNEGVRSVQSTPLVSRSGKLLGILSTHFSEIHALSEHELILVIFWLGRLQILSNTNKESTRTETTVFLKESTRSSALWCRA